MMSTIPPGWKLGHHNPFAIANFTWAFVNARKINLELRARVAELEAQIDLLRKGGSIPPEVGR
jgi:hypothetical protein